MGGGGTLHLLTCFCGVFLVPTTPPDPATTLPPAAPLALDSTVAAATVLVLRAAAGTIAAVMAAPLNLHSYRHW